MADQTLNEKAALIHAATKWWGDIVTNPPMSDIGADGDRGLEMAEMLKMMIAGSSRASEANRMIFELKLGQLIEEEENSRGYGRVSLKVDYHPDALLAQAARSSGVNADVFPFKTKMNIDFRNNFVEVSQGYGQPYRKIYPQPEV